jgi:pyruvate-formate lyase-activating enzyme
MQPRLRRGGTGMIFVTGGEPLVQGPAVGQLLRGCRQRGWRTQLETNGTLSPRRLGGRTVGLTT